MPRTIRFHLDENCPRALALGLRRRGIDVTTTPEAGLLQASDDEQSARALAEGRVKAYRDIEAETPQGPIRMPVALRPYPAGGALYELEFYVAVQACDGLQPGLYGYDPQHHQLIQRRGPTPDVVHLLRDAAASASIPAERLQILLILAARFPRLAWKYASIAYALTLKHVGVIYQTLYLAATAMDLAPCALGSGDSDAFARAAGVAYEAETSVGEFLIGSRG